jgi:GNAT superfamily N-acetyltransferase
LLHGSAPGFTPPFPGSVAKFVKPGSLFNRQDGEIDAFIGWRDGRPVGRIAAIANRSHNRYWDDRMGFFGFFACEENPETAAGLIGEVERVLRGKGCEAVRGPYNPSINDECGVMAEGSENPASVSMTWNPPYYTKLIEDSGMAVARTLYGYHLPLHIGVPTRVERIAERLRKRSPDVQLRSFDMSRLGEELRLVHRLYNVTLDRNWGFVPISIEDLLASAGDLKAFAEPDFLIFAEVDGEPAGFMLTLPNFNEILQRTKRMPHWLRLPWILWLMKTHRIRTVRQAVLGVAPEYRDRGLAALMCNEMVLRTKRQAESAELSWIEENNTEVIALIGLMGGVQSRVYHIYEKEL